MATTSFDAEKGSPSDGQRMTDSPQPFLLPRQGPSFPDDDDDLDDEDEDELASQQRTPSGIKDESKESNRNPLVRPLSKLKSQHWSTKLKRLLFPPKTSSDDFENFVPNYRYTPILSGIVIPFSILLEIPGLTSRWYIRTIDNEIVETQPNSVILDVGLGFSMFCAVCANICLVGRFLEWRVGLMTLLCVVLLTIHDVINIIALIVFGVEHRHDDGFTYGQAFWMTVCSTACSTFTNITLIVDLVKTKNFEVSGSGLTRKQRSLSIIIIILLSYVALGSLIHTFLLQLSFIDALYFTVITIESIGFGDFAPESAGARVFVCFYSVFGIVNLALAIGLIRETVLEGLEVGYYQRVQDIRRQRRVTAWKKRVVQRWHNAIQWRLEELGKQVWVPDPETNDSTLVYMFRKTWVWLKTKFEDLAAYIGLEILVGSIHSEEGKGSLAKYRHPRIKVPRGMTLNLEVLTQRQLESAAYEAGVPLAMLIPPDFWEMKQKREDEQKMGPRRRPTLSAPQFSGFLGSPGRSMFPSFSKTSSRRQSADGPRPQQKQQGSETPLAAPSANAADGAPIQSEMPTITPRDVYKLTANTQSGEEGQGMPLTQARMGRMIALMGKFALAVDSSTHLKTGVIKSRSLSNGPSNAAAAGAGGPSGHAADQPKAPAPSYDLFRESIEEGEKKAFYSRLTASWFLFLLFWTIGGVIFQATEGWTYGEALYFCVIAFTTIGYGDFSPSTPAGRSIFVAWALLGVGTMTVLISIVAEAYSDRYQNAMHSNVFSRAVKQYRSRVGNSNPFSTARRRRRPPPPTSVPHGTTTGQTSTALKEAEAKKNERLERLPIEMIRHARALYQHVQFFVGPNAKANSGNLSDMPENLRKLMEEISGEDRLAERIKVEILQDSTARETLFTIGLEKALKQLVDAAEDAIDVVTERDHLGVAHAISKEHEESVDRDKYRVVPETIVEEVAVEVNGANTSKTS